ncbi:MAG: response regulator [Deltaproteobacteria bacterium]|nr:response regulator [Deltaproteobacteria bacterium]
MDLVILDYNFPKHDGMFLLRELRESGHTTPVLVWTGQDDSGLAVDLMKNGAADFLPKAGLTSQRLSVSIRHALRRRASELAAGAVQEALRASDELNRRILECTHESVVVLDLAGHILLMSRAARELLEIPDLSLVHHRGWVDLWPEGEHRTAARNALLSAAQGAVGRFVGLGPSLSGAPLWWRVAVTPVLDADGKPERMVALGMLVPGP